MNKDVIYIEPEDDITDIITKIENCKEKIVALVPPKKAAVLRSIVNIKLLAKAGATAEKKIVLVTTDPSIIKLAAATRIPVTKNLQTAPTIPKVEEAEAVETTVKEEVVEKKDGEVEATEEIPSLAQDDEKPIDVDELKKSEDEAKADEEAEKSEKAAENDKKADKKAEKKAKVSKAGNNPFLKWVSEHKKILIFSGVGVIVLILVLVWMFAIVPAVTVTVGVRTTTTNFSENVTFTDKLAEENTSAGKFYLEEKKLETKSEVAFEATGKKNVGEKASGEVVVYKSFGRDGGTVPVNTGTKFSISGLSYLANGDVVLSWDGKNLTDCENYSDVSIMSGCRISGIVSVTAEEPGTNYNIAASMTGWSAVADIDGVYSAKAMTGGTDETITVVQQSDIDAAKAKLETANEAVNKEKLLATIKDSDFVIESSFKQTVGDAVSTPVVGEEVKSGEKAKLTVVTIDTIDVVDSTKVEEFIREKAKLADNYKIYELNDPFIENFTHTDDGYVAKLKTSYVSGPKITESDVVEIIKGKGIGTARQDLEKTFDGISKIVIEGNFPWVSSVPNDNNKITVDINVEEK